METLYYVKPREEELGPLTFAQLRSMWSRGEINVKTPFRYEEEETWQPLAILRRDLETGGPPPIQQIPPPLPMGNQAPVNPSVKSSNAGALGCFLLLLFGIVIFALSNSGTSPEEDAAAAKRKQEKDAMVSASLRQEVANAKTSQEKLRALEKLLKHQPGNLDVQTELQNVKFESLKDELSQPETLASRKVEILNELIALEPNDKKWQAQLSEEAKAAEREEAIKKQFSPWDGSHYELVKQIKLPLFRPKSFEHTKTTYSDMGDYIHISMRFTAEDQNGNTQNLRAEAHASLDGKQLELIEIRDELTRQYLFESGTEGVEVSMEAARAEVWKRDDGQEYVMVYVDWKNVGKRPVYLVKALIRAKDAKGRTIEGVGSSEPYTVFVAESGEPIMPGESYREPKGRGYVLGDVKMLQKLGFRNAEAKVAKAYGKRGLAE